MKTKTNVEARLLAVALTPGIIKLNSTGGK